MDIRMLGPFEVELAGEPLVLGGATQRSVLAVLALNARTAVSIDALAHAVWDGNPPASADTTLRAYISNLRRALEPGRGAHEPAHVLRTTPSGYVLEVADELIDARRFPRLLADGQRRRATDDLEGAVEVWTQALAQWRGPALQDFAYHEFAQPEARRLAELRLACLEDLFEARLELGDRDSLVGELDAFCCSHPDRERSLGLWMLALSRSGRQSDALRVYDDARGRLAEELGVDPSPELRAVHASILRQDDSPAGAAPGKRTLTFLLGDIERSTQRMLALEDDYSRLLEEQRRALTAALQAHNAQGIRLYGDETFAAFDCATDAVQAAVVAQLTLTRGPLPVRLGVHSGEASFSAGDYVGLAVNLAARIMDAAHGGQILLSEATKALLDAEAASGLSFADAGVHVLKDIPDTVRLFQVLHPELPRDFPPLRTRPLRNDNIPDRPTSLVGRERDVEEIQSLLSEARVVTLTGVGGVGKTRLALEVGSRAAGGYTDGAWLCELASLADGEALVAAVAASVGAQQQQHMSMRDSLLAALRQRRSLVILDNCEHLLQPVAELAEDIVHRCPGVDVLATSREMLGVDGEQARPVRSLRVEDDAVRLFEDRARAVRPDFTVDEQNAVDVAAVCGRVDGIPLAIELAAARVTSMSPAQIAARLEKDLSILRSRRRTAVDRHRTLHAAIEWSYAMLTDEERLLLERSSVFAGGFTLEAAEAVCGWDLDLDVADGLASLVTKSMVQAELAGNEARYTMLETIRQYAHDRLAARGELDATLGTHGRYFAQWFEDTFPYSGDYTPTVRRRLAEFTNVRAALEWATSVQDVDVAVRLVAGLDPSLAFWHARAVEAHGWAEAVAALPGAEHHPSFPFVLGFTANDLIRRGDRRRAEQLAQRGIELTQGGDGFVRAWPAAILEMVALYDGRLDDAARWNEEFLRLVRSAGFKWWEVHSLAFQALIEAYSGRHAAAIEVAEKACSLAKSDPYWRAFTLYALAEALGDTDPARALDCLDRAIPVFQGENMQFQLGTALVAQASLRARHGDPPDALPAFADLVNHWRLRGADWTQQWTTIRNLIELFGRLGADEPAVVLIAASEASPTAAPTFGAQGERLTALREELEGRMSPDGFGAACERGRDMSDEQAVAYAVAEIDAARHLSASGRRPQPS